MRWNGRKVLAPICLAWAVGNPAAQAQADGKAAPAPPAPRGSSAGAPAPRPVTPPDPRRMEVLLSQWEKQSKLLKSLDVKFRRVDHSPAWGDELYEGRALLQSPNLAWIDTKKVGADAQKKPTLKPHERIVCTGAEVWQFSTPTLQIFIFPLEKDQQQRALEEGPLPFLFNMRATEAKKRYQMTLIDEDKANYVVGVLPRMQIDKESFSKALIKLDKKYLLPTQIILFAPDGKSTQDYRFSDIKPNATVVADNFKPVALGPPWKVVRNPEQGAPQRPEGAGAAPAAARQPALRPGSTTGRRR